MGLIQRPTVQPASLQHELSLGGLRPEAMVDAIAWTDLAALNPSAVAGYDDGAISRWPPEAWAYFAGKGIPAAHITCLGSAASLVFDVEPGNASPAAAAQGMAARHAQGLPSVLYINEAGWVEASGAVRQAGLDFVGVERWPAPAGVYLWPADWTGFPHIPVWCPVGPVAVQINSFPGYDTSETYGAFPDATAPPGGTTVAKLDPDDYTAIAAATAVAIRQLSTPGGELFGRGVQEALQAEAEYAGTLVKAVAGAIQVVLPAGHGLTAAQVDAAAQAAVDAFKAGLPVTAGS